jgi:hypothetical protein
MMIDFESSNWNGLWIEKLIFVGLRNVATKVASLSLQAEEFNIAFEIVARIDTKKCSNHQ